MAYKRSKTVGVDDTAKQMLGSLGERVIEAWFRERGHHTAISLSMFNRAGDVAIDGHLAEVKTQEPWHQAMHPMHGVRPSFTIDLDHLKKCTEAPGGWFFVRIDTGDLYRVDPQHAEFVLWKQRRNDGEVRVVIPIDQPALTVFGNVLDVKDGKRALAEMRSFSTTTWGSVQRT